MTDIINNLQAVRHYHEISKHRQGKYADGPDSLDWDLQPDPFRKFEGCKQLELPLTARQIDVTLDELLTPAALSPKPVNLETIGQLFESSLGLSAWKVYGGDRWSLRCNPSSGNLHPTEAYLITNANKTIEAGIYHYQSHDHLLEQRCKLDDNLETNKSLLPEQCMLIGLSSIHWRESWKYGVRAYRYCQLDVGHAIAAIRYAAALQGWYVSVLNQASDEQIACLMGIERKEDFQRSEKETADVLLIINSDINTDRTSLDLEQLCKTAQHSEWKGTANILSPQGSIKWNEIDAVGQACKKPATPATYNNPPLYNSRKPVHKDLNTSQLLRQRRSAQAFDGKTILAENDFFQMLLALSADRKQIPFDCLDDIAYIHPVFYIHRVENLSPGLYVLPRSEMGMIILKRNFRNEFEWEKPDQCPDNIPLYRLVKAKCHNAARTLSCQQDIAAESAFTVSMIAEFDHLLEENPWIYRHLYYEAGIVGQALYIEAEAAGFRGTGIGCFFDDNIHEILGIRNKELQCLYNFTVGMPVVDTRLISLPPYSHLNNGT